MSLTRTPERTGFVEFCGIEIDRTEKAYCEGHCDLAHRHLNPWGISHGGLLFTLMDTVAGTAARFAFDGENPINVVTLSSNIYFMRPALPGTVNARARVIKAGGTVIVSEAEVYSGDTLLSKASFEFFVMRE